MKNINTIIGLSLSVLVLSITVACNDDDAYTLPEGIKNLSDDCLKNSIGVNMVGQSIDFSYAMAMPKGTGHIIEASVKASAKGSDGTYLDNMSYHTNGGYDEGVMIGNKCENYDNITKVTFTRDTCAATLRYFYIIPEELRGKEVSFEFSSKDSNGNRTTRKMGPYSISNMDMALDIKLKNKDCFSISRMRVLTKEEAEANPEDVDFVYSFQIKRGVTFNHAFISPTQANLTQYMQGITLPGGISNSTKMARTYGSCDQQLARNENAVFVDDIDMKKKTFDNTQDFMINIIEKGGAWMETADGKYRAYVYVNTAASNKGGMTISLKRLKMQQ
ncbi:DUF4466 family protein [Prevotella sp. PCHR]|uniref:DUF4466 family protein n=1 Tax=Xylanibacter caecicola TaxID=2736294 RepID=A0ABX2B5M1_9BACT|nr:DUF4466 family protein [Xylanibacter caecicola]NPE25975.1 DUF4466 family protein [Xylanibacter caecicola]